MKNIEFYLNKKNLKKYLPDLLIQSGLLLVLLQILRECAGDFICIYKKSDWSIILPILFISVGVNILIRRNSKNK